MSSPSVIRIATIEDLPEVWRLFRMGYGENALFPLDKDKALWHLKRALEPEKIHPEDKGMRGIIGVIGPVGALEAATFLTLATFWYTHHQHVEEYIVLVDEDHRKTDHAKAMINWMKQTAQEAGLPLITGILSNNRTQAKCRLYGRLLPKAGEFFVQLPNNWQPNAPY
jgi:GNAT superfamily N-acetyltransferase